MCNIKILLRNMRLNAGGLIGIVNGYNKLRIRKEATEKTRQEHQNDGLRSVKPPPKRLLVDVNLFGFERQSLLLRDLFLFLQLLVDAAHPVHRAAPKWQLGVFCNT